jgi:hypothetical protein
MVSVSEAEFLFDQIVAMSKDNENAITCHYYTTRNILVVYVSSGVLIRPDVNNLNGDSLSFDEGTGGVFRKVSIIMQRAQLTD